MKVPSLKRFCYPNAYPAMRLDFQTNALKESPL